MFTEEYDEISREEESGDWGESGNDIAALVIPRHASPA